MPNELTLLTLSNKIRSEIGAVTEVARLWAIPLIDPALDQQRFLREKLFVILISGLTDAARGPASRINELRQNAERLNSERALYYLAFLKVCLDATVDLLSLYSRDEMIFVSQLRNQWVHGQWPNIHSNRQRARYVRGRELVTEQVEATAYWAAFRSVNGADNNDALMRLRRRLIDHKTIFWRLVNFMSPLNLENLHDDILAPASSPAVDTGWCTNLGFDATTAQVPGAAVSLFEVRAQVHINDAALDPVFTMAR